MVVVRLKARASPDDLNLRAESVVRYVHNARSIPGVFYSVLVSAMKRSILAVVMQTAAAMKPVVEARRQAEASLQVEEMPVEESGQEEALREEA